MQIRILAGCTSLIMAAAIAVSAPSTAIAAQGVKPMSDAGSGDSATATASSARATTPASKTVFYPRSNYVWPFASGPVYGTVDNARWRSPGVLHMAVGSFDLTRGRPNFPPSLLATNKLATLGRQYFLLQVDPESFTNGVFDQMKGAITAQGGAIVGEMPVGAFIVRMTPAAFELTRGFASIIALEPFHPAFKISPDIGRSPLADPVQAVSSVYSLGLRLFPGEDAQAVTATLASLGITVKRGDIQTLHVEADRSKLAALAGIDAIQAIYEDLPIILRSEETTTTVQTGRWNNGATPYTDAGIDGGGADKASFADDQLLMVLDNGIQLDAGDLANTRTDGASTTPVGSTHRKVQFYGTTNVFGGSGDLLGCDNASTNGFTHGHMVSIVALGNATRVPAGYGNGWQATDQQGNPWDLDGIAPRARLVAYDGGLTPTTGNCDDPRHIDGTYGLEPGTIYTSPNGGSLADGYSKGARVVNFSWGSSANTYTGYPQDIDQFLYDKGDALVFVSAGNDGKDADTNTIPDAGTLGTPATFKNGIGVGASANANDQYSVITQNVRTNLSSVGPATSTSGRIQPILMAPGTDIGAMGMVSEFSCRSNDNDQSNPVECDIKENPGASTSWAAPAAAGAALLIRDYFAQGFYPDGTATNPNNAADKVSNISGDLLKAILVTSADWMHLPGSNLVGTQRDQGLTRQYRFNREQGYGRVNLSHALPLQSYSGAVSGLIVDDGGLWISPGVPGGLIHSTNLVMNLAPGADSGTYSLSVCDDSQPLRIAIAWMDPSTASDSLSRDLNLEVTSPTGLTYLGNFFTDDADLDGVITAPSEDCVYNGQTYPYPPALDSLDGFVDQGPFSLPSNICASAAAHVDTKNPVEAVFLSPDSANNGVNNDPNTAADESTDNQIELGQWTVKVLAPGSNAGNVNYAIAMSGGVCLGSDVRVQRALRDTNTGLFNNQYATGAFACNDSAVITVNEKETGGDPAITLTTGEISSRSKIEVVDPGTDGVLGTNDDFVTDTESNLVFTDADLGGAGLRFDSASILLADGTAPDPGNGVLDVRSGQSLRAVYQDEEPNGSPVANLRRLSIAAVDCRPLIAAGGVVFGQFGRDAFTLVSGGCEKDERGYFTFGFPDRYMDEGEVVGYLVAFQSAETGATLQNVTVSLKAVAPDGDSPVDCKPGSVTCADPTRSNNPPSPYLTVLDSPKVLGTLPAGSTITPTFTIQVAASITGVQQADMVLGVSAKTAGKGVENFAVQRETLNADEVAYYYSTDYPTGGSLLNYDINNNEVIEDTTNSTNNFLLDYIHESGALNGAGTRTYSDMTVGGYNTLAALKAPWNFDSNDGGFTTGINNRSVNNQGITIAFWGEDKNFNNRLDGFCSGNTRLSCTDDNGISENCFRCSNDLTRPCNTGADCLGGASCDPKGTCNFTLGEDRDQANGVLDQSWNTQGGCGWQTAVPGSPLGYPSGGVWHTGLIGSADPLNGSLQCIAAGIATGRCQSYERFTLQTPATGSNWWEMLLTPVLNKVNQCPSSNGSNCPRADLPNDPVYQVAITDWAWNMLIDLADNDTAFFAEFDTDIDKLQGAEFYNDLALTSIRLFGNQGAVSDGNAPITSGFNLFAPISKCVDTDGVGQCSNSVNACAVDADCPGGTCTKYLDHCGSATGADCFTDQNDTNCTGNNRNGNAGPSRDGQNNCYFEGRTATNPPVAIALQPYGLSTPIDDDRANSYCERSDALNGIDKSISCNPTAALPNAKCKQAGGTYTVCHVQDVNVDEFVQKNGPGRNYGIQVPNGPDMRFTTLEDFYGETGKRFQGAFGFRTFEPTAGSGDAPNSYGIAVDDMVVSWKETRLDADTHTCAGSGECADIELKSTLAYDATSIVEITVTDKTPYDTTNNKNDCNGDTDYVDVTDDQDCNNNGTLDVTVKLTSDAEVTGEIAVLDQVSPGSAAYKGRFPYSSTYNSPGTLFIAVSGTNDPVITARYEDRNDGTTGTTRCKNALDPTQQGFIGATTTVTVAAGRIDFKSYSLRLVGAAPTNGDNDGFADAQETIDMAVTVTNKSGVDLDDLTATLGTTDPNIECISTPVVSVPAVPGLVLNNTSALSAPFRFKIANVNRTSVDQVMKATFNLTLRSKQFEAITRSMSLTIDLDLNASGGGGISAFIEDFEAGPTNFGKFTLQTLDAGKNSLSNSNGMRCQYNDPDALNTNSAGDVDCFLGFASDGTTIVNDWHVHTGTAAQGGVGRAYTGAASVHWGVHNSSGSGKRDTGRFKQLDAIVTVNPINLPTAAGNPELVFAHQVALVDNRGIGNITAGEVADRAIVQVNVLSVTGQTTNWVKLQPYENVYEQQGTDDFTNCTFDPTDDGNTEDTFFDPTDPGRDHGPSSTCYPEFAFSRSGDADYRNVADPTHVGFADQNAGLQGSINVGTWVRPRFSLLPFATRRIKLRFLGTSIELGTGQTWDAAFFNRDDVVADDGWYVDAIRIDTALGIALSIAVDTKNITPLATCGACTSVNAALVATPTTTAGLGQLATLEAKTSAIDLCVNGLAQYQFWLDSNNNSVIGDVGDTLLRDFTDNSTFIDAPSQTSRYGVKVRCSSANSCDSGDGSNTASALVTVPCPSSGNAKAMFGQSIRVNKGGIAGVEPDVTTTVSWTSSSLVDGVRGNLSLLKSSGGLYTGTVAACIANNVTGAALASDAVDPGSGNSLYYLIRPSVTTYCNETGLSYSSGNVKEVSGRDTEIAADGNACP